MGNYLMELEMTKKILCFGHVQRAEVQRAREEKRIRRKGYMMDEHSSYSNLFLLCPLSFLIYDRTPRNHPFIHTFIHFRIH